MDDHKSAAITAPGADQPLVAELAHESPGDHARSYASSTTAAPVVDKQVSADSDALSRKGEDEGVDGGMGTRTPEEIERESKYLTGSASARASSKLLFLRVPKGPDAVRRG